MHTQARLAVLAMTLVFATPLQAALTIPVYESFNGIDTSEEYTGNGTNDFVSLPEWTAVTQTGGRIAFRNDFQADPNFPGFIVSMDNPSDESINGIITTIDASALTVQEDALLLSFDWYSHGDEADIEDGAFVRGSVTDAWIKIYDFGANPSNARWTSVARLNISDTLLAGTHQFSATTQIMFQQSDNFPIATDGISIDNVFVELAAPATAATDAGLLAASLVNYDKAPVPNGEQVELLIRVANPVDAGADATNVTVDIALPAELSMPGSSVSPSQGTVTSGNTEGDTTVTVNLGTLTDGQTATIRLLADLTHQGNFTFTTQANVSADGLTAFLSDDPDNNTGNADATTVRVFPFLADLAIDNDNPRKFSTAAISSTPGPSSEPVAYSSLTTDTCVVNSTDQLVFIEQGLCTLAADQAGDGDWPDAAQITLDIDVGKEKSDPIVVIDDEDDGLLGNSSLAFLLMMSAATLLRRRRT